MENLFPLKTFRRSSKGGYSLDAFIRFHAKFMFSLQLVDETSLAFLCLLEILIETPTICTNVLN